MFYCLNPIRTNIYISPPHSGVQVAGNFAEEPNTAKLCTKIEAQIFNAFFIDFTDTDTKTQIKDYVRSAAVYIRRPQTHHQPAGDHREPL